MELERAVAAALERNDKGGGLGEALGLIRDDLGVSRISLHAVNGAADAFRVLGSAGDDILGTGTQLPLETSTQVAVPARGEVFALSSFEDDPAFDRALDQLVVHMGFRSGCSVPLLIGSGSIGGLCVSSRRRDVAYDSVIDVLNRVSPAITLAVHAAHSESAWRILVCHDDPLLAEGMARVLEHAFAAEVQICATTQEALRQCERSYARFDTMICPSFFGGERVDGFLRALRAAGMGAPALVVAPSNSPLGRSLAVRSGAAGYFPFTDGPAGLIEAVRSLAAGRASGFDDPAPAGADDDLEFAHLTPQESKVLLLLERGLRFKQIALSLGITESTAKGYARSLFAKLSVHSRGEAVFEARRQGILDHLQADEEGAPDA